MQSESILVIGLGNPILGDDGVGWQIAGRVAAALGYEGADRHAFDPAPAQLSGIEIDRLCLGGLSLMERLVGYRQVILIDSIQTGCAAPGFIWTFTLDQLGETSGGHLRAPHDTSLQTALRVGRSLGADLPPDHAVYVIAVEIRASMRFSDRLSPPVSAAVTAATRSVLSRLQVRQPGLEVRRI